MYLVVEENLPGHVVLVEVVEVVQHHGVGEHGLHDGVAYHPTQLGVEAGMVSTRNFQFKTMIVSKLLFIHFMMRK